MKKKNIIVIIKEACLGYNHPLTPFPPGVTVLFILGT